MNRLSPLLLMAALVVGGCGASIGDPCVSNIDCSPLGDRFCDTAPLGGYCTIEDCNQTTAVCPSEAVCIRFFSPVAGETCTFDPAAPFSRSDCPHVDDRCVCDNTNDQGVCVDNAGTCAPSSTEREWCQRRCSHDSDCRSGFECRRTGTFGAEPLPTFSTPAGDAARFCAPKPVSF